MAHACLCLCAAALFAPNARVLSCSLASSRASTTRTAARKEELGTVEKERLLLQAEATALEAQLNEKKEAQRMIRSVMTRQYKAMQEEVTGRIEESVQTIAELETEMKRVREEALTRQQTNRAEMALKARKKAALEKKLVDVTAEFGEMMTETIEAVKQSSPIQVENESWKKQTGIDLIRKIHEVSTDSGAAAPARESRTAALAAP